VRRPLAELAEEEREPRLQSLPGSASDALHDVVRELVAQEAATVQRLPDRRPNRFDLVGVDRRVEYTGGIAPCRQRPVC
jgi:hypothetical protein